MTLSAVLFIMLVAVTFSAAMGVVVRESDGTRSKVLIGVFGTLLYLIIPGVLASRGLIDSYDPFPIPMAVVLVATGITIWFARSSFGERLAGALPLAALVGFQVFRIPVELLLHQLWKEGIIPQAMTFSGWNFDILTGLSAGILGFVLARGRVNRVLLRAWNAVGLLLLLTIVAIATLATPVLDSAIFEGPRNTLPGTFPFVWLPTVLVQLALLGHLLLFRRLSSEEAAV